MSNPSLSNVVELFETISIHHPERSAVTWSNSSCSYKDLNRQANLVAHRLAKQGIGRGDVVAIQQPRALQMIVGIIGILKSGAAYLPLDMRSPEGRLLLLCEDAGVRAAIVSSASEASWLPQIVLAPGIENAQDPGNLAIPIGLDEAAYVMYTSGSTGTPKGVEIPHRAILRLVIGCDFASLGAHTVCLHHSPPAFDASTLEVWGPLLNGGRCHLAPSDLDLSTLISTIESAGLNLLWLTASLFNAIVELSPEVLANVSHVITGGEALSPTHIRLAQQAAPQTHFTNGYGPTESTTFACCYPIPPSFNGSRVPIGKPINKTHVHLMDEAGNPVARGLTGEIYIGGEGLAIGYRNRPEATASAFVLHGERLYRSGDLACIMPDGNLDFLGRKDRQVKVRGFRIELEEIEVTLLAHPAVAAACVLVQQVQNSEKRLVGFILLRTDTSISAIRDYLAQKLPDYMIPAVIEILPEFPLSASGKTDRSALAHRTISEPVAPDYVAPDDGTETEIAVMAAELLGRPILGKWDNLLDFGAHSLILMRLLARIRSRWDVSITMKDVYDGPTIAAISSRLQQIGAQQPKIPPIHLSSDPVKPAVLSYSQEGHWTLDRLGMGGLHHVIPLGFELKGNLDVQALSDALADITARHEVLRTIYDFDSKNQVCQSVREPDPSPLSYVSENSEHEWKIRCDEFLKSPMDLASGPLFRALLARLSNDRHILVLSIHHIAFDGWSLGIFRRELSQYYAAHVQKKPVSRPVLKIQYSDFAAWQRSHLIAPEPRPALRALPPFLELSTKRRSVKQTFSGRRQQVELSPELCAQVRILGASVKASLFMTLLAALKLLLARYSHQDDIVIGTPWANRDTEAVEDLMGFFVNTLLIRTKLDLQSDFRSLLSNVRESSLDAFSSASIPLAAQIDAARVPHNSSYSLPFQILFVLQNSPRGVLSLPGIEVTEMLLDNGSAQVDLTISLEEGGDGLTGYIEFNTDLFDTDFAKDLWRHFSEILKSAIAYPSRPISELPLMSSGEVASVMLAGTGEVADYPKTNLACLFEERTAQFAESDAIFTETGTWNFAELQARSNAVAWQLLDAGVEPGSLIGLCMGRSPQVVASILGIWKAGAVYVPLDPTYPQERLEWIIKDANLKLLLTDLETKPSWFREPVLVWEEIDHSRSTNVLPQNPDPGKLAYVFYTSGSTGRPKGVAGEHGAVLNRLHWMWAQYPYAPNERTCLKTPLNFIDSLCEIVGPLIAGIPTVVISKTALTDSRQLLNILERYRVTRIILVPSLLKAILEVSPDLATRLPALRFWVCSGEALKADLAARFLTEMPSCKLLNLYGSSEVCADVTWHEVSVEDTGCIPIGRPITNTQLSVLDPNRQLVPVGVPGELYVGGAPLAQGYWNNPELTSNCFIQASTGRLFRTGDRVLLNRSGEFEYLGRIDSQVKINGQRVEPEEVAVLLRAIPGIREAVVVASDDSFLAGFVVADFGNPKDWLENLRRKLPSYMLPGAITILESIPLLPNGKVDKVSLAKVVPKRLVSTGIARPPQGKLECELFSIWESLIPGAPVDTNCDFFAIGGNSLTALRMFANIESKLGVILPAASIFEAPTVKQLADLIRNDANAPSPLIIRIRREGPGNPLFCMHGAKGGLLEYTQLAEEMSGVCPVYGILAAGLDGFRSPHWRAEKMLDEYVSGILEAQPQGPYRICGHSYGAIVAYAVACRLESIGAEIEFLGLFDMTSEPLVKRSSAKGYLNWILSRIFAKLRLYRQESVTGKWNRLRSDLCNQLDRLRFHLQSRRLRRGALSDLPLDQCLQMIVRSGYRPVKFNGKATLFRAEIDDEYLATQPKDLGWDRLVNSGVKVSRVPGDHNTMMLAPNVGYLAKEIRLALETHRDSQLS